MTMSLSLFAFCIGGTCCTSAYRMAIPGSKEITSVRIGDLHGFPALMENQVLRLRSRVITIDFASNYFHHSNFNLSRGMFKRGV